MLFAVKRVDGLAPSGEQQKPRVAVITRNGHHLLQQLRRRWRLGRGVHGPPAAPPHYRPHHVIPTAVERPEENVRGQPPHRGEQKRFHRFNLHRRLPDSASTPLETLPSVLLCASVPLW